MGCDCHPYAESRQEDGTWTFLKKIYYDDPDPGLDAFKSRDYQLFGILAGVRNRRYPALFEGRGLPKDANAVIRRVFDEDSYHSATHFMVQELLDTNWDSVIGQEEIALDPSAYLQWLEAGRRGIPDNLVLGQDVQVSEEEMVLLLAGGLRTKRTGRTKPTNWHKLKPMKYVEVVSTVTYRDVIPTFVNKVIPALIRLGDPQKVRIVIGFDS